MALNDKRPSVLSRSITQVKVAFGMLLLAAANVRAELPTMAEPPDGIVDGNYMLTGRNFIIAIVAVVGGLMVAGMMYAVVRNLMGVYADIHLNKKTWTDMMIHGAGGLLLIVIVVFLATQAVPVLQGLGE